MRSVFGGLLVLIGIGMAVLWMPGHDGEQQLAVVTEIATQGIARVARTEAASSARQTVPVARTFSPQTPLLSQDPAPAQSAPAVRTASTSTPLEAVVMAANSVVMQSSPSNAGGAARFAGLRPTDDTSRAELVRSMQRELKRVGCYHGDTTGDWGTTSKRALDQFMERVNATLPHEEPDYILLTLLQGHTGTACGKQCPAGQSASEAGRCMPNAVLAQTARRAQEVAASQSIQVGSIREPARRTASREREQQPRSHPSGQSEVPPAVVSTWSTTVASAGSTGHAQPAPAVPSWTGATAGMAAASVLPGRMAIGGPRASSTQDLIAPIEPSPAAHAVQHGLSTQLDPVQGDDRDRGVGRSAAAPIRPVVVYRSAPSRTHAPQSPPPRRTVTYSKAWMTGFFDRQH